ncbi:hypothetical protein [Emticicia sp. BO119]|uniref:hypothetical protein n=1 Tax=Emticicia sp. BO119 TaxID=2757768 RepID=UPI0015F0AF24|nr:hypothetical protein [Emticicia sp. BO119]MBA4850963.1 hypothetical protein [Emticicia sp. BO119]
MAPVKITKQNLFLVFFSLIFFSLSLPAGYAGFDIDASWHEALVMAIDKNFVFGRDFIFNYGPLGYLNTGLLPKTVSHLLLVAVEIFTLFNYLIIIRFAFAKAGKKWWIVAVSALLIFMPWGFIADTSFTLFYFFLFWLLHAQQTRNSVGLLLAFIISVFVFYIKVNLSIVVYILFYASLIYFYIARYFTLRTVIIVAVLQVLLTYALSFMLNVDIPAYLGASTKIIDSYQDGMAAMLLSQAEFLPLLVFEGLILLVAGIFILLTFQWKSAYLYILVAITWFLSFKQAHTAVGHYNVFGFFLFMSPLAVLLYLFTEERQKIWAGRAFIAILVLQLSATQVIRYYMGEHTLKGYALTYPPSEVAKAMNEGFKLRQVLTIVAQKNPVNYLKRLFTYDYEDNFRNIPIKLPQSLVDKIGNETVDIVPHQVTYLFFNQLNYNPRPVIQSYQANSDWLMQKNGEKYLSETAPKFVVYHVESFREQNPFWVETDLTKALLKNYQLTDTTLIAKDTFFVFQHQPISNILKTVNTKDITFRLDEDIIVPITDNPIVFSADIDYSLKGKVARLFFQPPYLHCLVTYENGKQENFRVIDKILKGGIFISPKVTTQAEAASFFLNRGKNNLKVRKIRFWAKYSGGFGESFKGRFQEYTMPAY